MPHALTRRSQECSGEFRLAGRGLSHQHPSAMDITLLDRPEAIPTPFDDVFDPELLRCGPVLEALSI